jgi:hypothetical protein
VCVEKEAYDSASRQKFRVPFGPFNVPVSAADQSFCFIDVFKLILTASGLDTTDIFTPGHTLPYASLFVRGADEGNKSVTLHRLRNLFGSVQGGNASPDDLRTDHPAHLAYARDQWFIQTLNGGSFVSFEDAGASLDDFQRFDLPNHTKGIYYCANLFALYQRFTLAHLSERVATKALDGGDKDWEDIRDDLLDFTARGYFTQAMQSDHHHRYYRKWQEVFQISRLYEEVRNEVQDMYERATLRLRKQDDDREKREEEREKRMDNILTALGFLFVIPSLLLSFLGVNIRHITSGDEGLTLTTALLIFGLGFTGSCLAWFLLKKLTARNK